MKKYFVFLMLPLYMFALGPLIDYDEFNETNGNYIYTSDGSDVPIKEDNLYLDRSKYAETTYSPGEEYANHEIEVKIKVILPEDVTIGIFKNGSKKDKLDETQEYTLLTELNETGEVRIGFKQYDSDSYAYVDYVRIYDKTIEYQDHPRDFTKYSSDNIKGNILTIGNSVLESNDSKCVDEETTNNNINAIYVDKDDNDTTYNSTWAKLTLPEGITSDKIKYVLLYWQGRVEDNEHAVLYGKKVKIKLPGVNNDNYQEISTNENKFNYIKGNYQGTSDITTLFKESVDKVLENNSSYSEKIWVADVYTNEGENAYGAWSIVIVYEDENAHLKNITFYDGFDKLYENNKTYELNGFTTPTKGEVVSKFIVFAGEGDVGNNDGVYLTDKEGEEHLIDKDFFKSAEDIDGINIEDRDTNCSNTIGIDLRTISVGTNSDNPIIENGQTSTILRLSSVDDAYYPGFFAFSTDLYEPRVCYYIDTIKDLNDHVIYENGNFVDSVEDGKEYKINLWFANMKKDETDDDVEDAKKVKVYLNTKDYNYTNNSTFIQNLGEDNLYERTDIDNDDIFETNTTFYTYRIGEEANETDGGDLYVTSSFGEDENKTFVQMNGQFNTNGSDTIDLDEVFHFTTSFQVSNLETNNNTVLNMPKCKDFDTSGTVLNGVFNVVSSKFDSDIDPTDLNDERNYLYTQIANKDFNIKIVHLDNDYETLTDYKGVTILQLIKTPIYSKNDSNETKERKCEEATKYKSKNIYFDNTNLKNENFKYDNIKENVTFRIKYLKDSNLCNEECEEDVNSEDCNNCLNSLDKDNFKYVCARDNFAIRPDRFIFTVGDNAKADNNISSIEIKAIDYNGNIVDYSQTGDNLKIIVKDRKNCIEADPKYDLNISNGVSNIKYFKYPEVGEVEFNISEVNQTEFAKVDEDDTPINERFISNGISDYISIYPDHFNIENITVSNFNDGNFTYLSNDLNMSGKLNATIIAKNANEDTTLNYNNYCYSKDINVSISHNDISNIKNLNYIINQYNKNNIENNITFKLKKENFINGENNLNLNLNLDRNHSIPIIPFNLNLNDIFITDENEINGTNSINDDLYFLYGRIKTNNKVTIEKNIISNIIFEYYDKNRQWTKNIEHNDKILGSVFNIYTKSSSNDINVELNENNITSIQNLNIIKYNNTTPYKVLLHLFIPSWLWYGYEPYKDPNLNNLNCFTHPCNSILFLGKSKNIWSGKGIENNVNNNTINSQIKQNVIQDKSFQKINW